MPWPDLLEAEDSRLDEPWGDAFGGKLTRRSYQNGFRRIAHERSEYAGIPVALPGTALTFDPSYPMAEAWKGINRATRGAREDVIEHIGEEITLRNQFWSKRLGSMVMIFREGTKTLFALYPPKPTDGTINETRVMTAVKMTLDTLGCFDIIPLEAELRAMNSLRGLIDHHRFRQYFLTGTFLESSPRSGVFYMFRRLRPTLAFSYGTGAMHLLCALCLHPIAYYSGSWAGSQCPTDDVIAHLMLMRGDEHMFWKRANQHDLTRIEAGI